LIYYSGELAALLTSILWMCSSVLFTQAGMIVGSVIVNRTRLLFASLLLLLAHPILGLPIFSTIETFRWIWLGLSGLIGLALGDALLFQAYVLIGPRLSMLLMSLAPILTLLAGWLFLKETLTPLEVFGIFLTVAGIGWVVMERNGKIQQATREKQIYWQGLLLAFGSAFTQTFGYITSKIGLADNFPPLTGTLIRVLIATLAMWAITVATGQFKKNFTRLNAQPISYLYILGGSTAGPFLGITFSLYALQNAPVGVASTLLALTPIFLLPVGYLFFKERFGWQAVLGTILAISGVAILFLA